MMGKIITVLSPEHRTGKTTLIYMLLNHLCSMGSEDSRMQVLCIDASHGNLLKINNIDPGKMSFEDMVNLKLYPDTTKIDYKGVLPNKGSIFFLQSDVAKQAYIKNNIGTYAVLLEDLKNSFDLVVVDTGSEKESFLNDLFITKSDCTISVIDQDLDALNDNWGTSVKPNVLVVNRYADIFPECRDLTSILKPDSLFTLPFCRTLLEMKNKGKLDLYSQHETEYNKGLSGLASHIAKTLGLKVSEMTETSKSKRLFSLLWR